MLGTSFSYILKFCLLKNFFRFQMAYVYRNNGDDNRRDGSRRTMTRVFCAHPCHTFSYISNITSSLSIKYLLILKLSVSGEWILELLKAAE